VSRLAAAGCYERLGQDLQALDRDHVRGQIACNRSSCVARRVEARDRGGSVTIVTKQERDVARDELALKERSWPPCAVGVLGVACATGDPTRLGCGGWLELVDDESRRPRGVRRGREEASTAFTTARRGSAARSSCPSSTLAWTIFARSVLDDELHVTVQASLGRS